MEDRFERFTDSFETTLSDLRPDQKIVVQETIELWRKLHAEGVCAYDFAHGLKNVSETVMLHFDSLEEALEFGKSQKASGEIMIRAVSEHWPPIDPKDWPEDV